MYRFIPFLLAALLATEVHAEQKKNKKTVADSIFANPGKFGMKFNPGPNQFMVNMIRDVKPGKALDVGMGQGRNALYLAQQGWDVTGFDIAETGVMQAVEEAEKLHVKLNASVQSYDDYDFGKNRWDLVILCYIDFRHLVARVRESLKPGGIVIVEYYHQDTQKYRYVNQNRTFSNNELLQVFSDFRILHYEDVMDTPDWTNKGGEKHRLVRLVAQKTVVDQAAECYWDGQTYDENGQVCYSKKMLKCGKSGWELTQEKCMP